MDEDLLVLLEDPAIESQSNATRPAIRDAASVGFGHESSSQSATVSPASRTRTRRSERST